jgi:hypothetical protein
MKNLLKLIDLMSYQQVINTCMYALACAGLIVVYAIHLLKF